MKREFKGAGAREFIDILDRTPLVRNFLTYVEKRAHTPRAVEELMASASLRNEFIAKCEWIQQMSRREPTPDVSMENAAIIVNLDSSLSSVSAFKGEIFNGFMHFIVANEKDPSVLSSIMTTWATEGRTLVELDSTGLTPAQVAIYTQNIISFAALAVNGVDITATDKDGLSPLHIIVNKVKDGSADIALLRLWLEKGLPTNMKSGEEAGINAGKTAAEFAQALGLVKVTKILTGDVALAAKKSDESFSVQKGLITQTYHLKLDANPAMKAAVAGDKNKLLLDYLVENYAEIEPEVFIKFLADKGLGIKTNIILGGRTPLQKCVELGYNDWALALVKMGVGSGSLDNGVTVLNYCVSADNDELLKMIKEDGALDLASFALATKQ